MTLEEHIQVWRDELAEKGPYREDYTARRRTGRQRASEARRLIRERAEAMERLRAQGGRRER